MVSGERDAIGQAQALHRPPNPSFKGTVANQFELPIGGPDLGQGHNYRVVIFRWLEPRYASDARRVNSGTGAKLVRNFVHPIMNHMQ
jgi:hypothetical protein